MTAFDGDLGRTTRRPDTPPRPPRQLDEPIVLLVGDTDDAWRAVDAGLAAAAQTGRRLTTIAWARPRWWSGVGTAACMLHGGFLTPGHTADELRLDFGLPLVASGYEAPMIVVSANQLCTMLLRASVEHVIVPLRLARRLRRPLRRCGVAVTVIP